MARISTDAVREAHNTELHELATLRYGVRLKRVGAGEYAGPCPSCGGRDRFSVNVKKRLWNCRGCAPAANAIALVQHVDNCSLRRGRPSLTGGPWTPAAPKRPVPITGARVAANDHLEAADRIWRRSRPDRSATPGEAYLAGRGIDLTEVPDHGGLRFARALPVGDRDHALHHRPIHRRAQRRAARDLAPAGQRREAEEPGADRRLSSSACGPTSSWSKALLLLGEGVETTLAAATRLIWRGQYLRPAWAAGNANNMASLPVLPGIKSLITWSTTMRTAPASARPRRARSGGSPPGARRNGLCPKASMRFQRLGALMSGPPMARRTQTAAQVRAQAWRAGIQVPGVENGKVRWKAHRHPVDTSALEALMAAEAEIVAEYAEARQWAEREFGSARRQVCGDACRNGCWVEALWTPDGQP